MKCLLCETEMKEQYFKTKKKTTYTCPKCGYAEAIPDDYGEREE